MVGALTDDDDYLGVWWGLKLDITAQSEGYIRRRQDDRLSPLLAMGHCTITNCGATLAATHLRPLTRKCLRNFVAMVSMYVPF